MTHKNAFLIKKMGHLRSEIRHFFNEIDNDVPFLKFHKISSLMRL